MNGIFRRVTEADITERSLPQDWCAWQGAPQTKAAGARAEFGAEEGELDPVEEQRKFKAAEAEQPFWPQDQLVSDMAIHLALMVEQLGLSASPNDWTQVRSSWHDPQHQPSMNHSCGVEVLHMADPNALIRARS